MAQMIGGIRVVAEESITEAEIAEIVATEKTLWRAQNKEIAEIHISVEEEELVITSIERSPIKRVRRITGYLSTNERFNDAKQAELSDRVSHF